MSDFSDLGSETEEPFSPSEDEWLPSDNEPLAFLQNCDLNTPNSESDDDLRNNNENRSADNEDLFANDANTSNHKKRRLNPEQWKRNKQKAARLIKKQPSNFIPFTCRCKCDQKLSAEDIQEILDTFNNFKTHTEQNIYLRGCVRSTPTKRLRNKNKPPRQVFTYSVTCNSKNESVTVCQNFFLHLHGIKRDRLRRKILKFNIRDMEDRRGKHQNRRNRVDAETTSAVYSFLESLPAVESHYSRSENKTKKYLPSDLSIVELHRKYIQQNDDKPVSYSIFYKIFNEDFNYSFSHPRKDICATCSKFAADINSAQLHKHDGTLKTLITQKELQLRKAQAFFDQMKEKKQKADETEMTICFDFQKNLPLPVTNIGEEYYLRQLWLHNFGINDIVSNKTVLFLFTENFATKGPNEVITALDYYIQENKKPQHVKLTIFCDNCFSQNKNRFLYTYLDALVRSAVFQEIVIMYPLPGHSMMPIDRCFALIEKKRIKAEKVDNPEYYVNLMKSARLKQPFCIVFLEHTLLTEACEDIPVIRVKDYKKMYSSRIKSSVPGIAKCRSVLFTAHRNPQMRDTMGGPYCNNVILYKVGQHKFTAGIIPDMAYQGFLKIKESKLENIKFLIQYIEKEENKKFYEVLDQGNVEKNRRSEEDVSDLEDNE